MLLTLYNPWCQFTTCGDIYKRFIGKRSQGNEKQQQQQQQQQKKKNKKKKQKKKRISVHATTLHDQESLSQLVQSTKFLLTLESERYTIYFDIGRKP